MTLYETGSDVLLKGHAARFRIIYLMKAQTSNLVCTTECTSKCVVVHNSISKSNTSKHNHCLYSKKGDNVFMDFDYQ